MAAKIGSLNVDLTIETARFEQGLGRVQSALKSQDTQLRAVAQRMAASGEALGRSMDRAVPSAGSMRAGMQQLSFQLGDVATQFAGGQKAMTIFAQQSSQVVQAIALMSGGAGRFGAFMSGPWGLALTAGAVVVGSLAEKLFDTESALDKVRFASSAVGDAQSILGNVMDLTTGKITTQSSALLSLAKAQLAVARIQAQARAADARSTLQGITAPRTAIGGGLGGGLFVGPQQPGIDQRIVQQVIKGIVTPQNAIDNLNRFQTSGRITADQFAKAAAAIANLNVEMENIKVLGSAESLLTGTGGRELLRPGSGAGRSAGRGGASRSLGEVHDSVAKAANALQAMEDRLLPQAAALRKFSEDMAAITAAERGGQLSSAMATELRQALELERFKQTNTTSFADAFAPFEKLAKGSALVDIDAAMAALTERTRELKVQSKEAADTMGKSFQEAADGVIGALDRMSSAFKGGSFLDKFSAIVSLGLQLGSVGVFGKKVAANINIPRHANGTSFAPGGLSLVGELGPELVDLNRGARVYNNRDTRGLLRGGAPSRIEVVPSPLFEVYIDGKLQKATPAIIGLSSAETQGRMARSASRRLT